MDTKPSSEWLEAWKGAQGRVAANYKKGIDRNSSWHEKALKGQGNYVEAMSDPNTLARRESGLQATDQGKWKAKAAEKGARNIVSGMKSGESDYGAAASKSQAALAGTTLPERTLDVDQNIANRVGGTAHALRRAWGKE